MEVYVKILIIAYVYHQGNILLEDIKIPEFFAKLDIRKYFFAVRTVNLWNALPDGVERCKMIRNFVTKLKCAELVKFLTGHACI